MAREHAPFQNQGGEHAPFLNIGGSGGGLSMAELLEVLAGTKEPKSVQKAALSEEINNLLGKSGPPTGLAGGVLAGEYPNPSLAAESVTTAAIKLLAITEALLGAEAVSTAKIKLLAITSALIANGAVIAEKLGAEAVGTAALKLLSVTEPILAEESVGEKKLVEAIRNLINGAVQRSGKYKLIRDVKAINTPFQPSTTKGTFIVASFGSTGKTTPTTFSFFWGETELVVEAPLYIMEYTPKTTGQDFGIMFYIPPGHWWKWTATENLGTVVINEIQL